MNVQQLINELSKMPKDKPVRVLLSEVYDDGEMGMKTISLYEGGDIEVDGVYNRGSYVLIEGK